MKKIFFATLLFLCISGRANAQQVDSCLDLYQNVFTNQGDLVANPDSAMVDTCMGTEYYEEFIKTRFQIEFYYFVLSDSITPNGDTIFVRSWRDIDTAYPQIRNGFSNIESRFGPFTLLGPNLITNDTSIDFSKIWEITFSNYVCVDSVISYLDSIPEVGGQEFNDGIARENGSVHQVDIPKVEIWPQPCDEILYISGLSDARDIECFDQLGRPLHFPVSSITDGLSVDVSNATNGIIFLHISENSFKIIVQK